MAFFVGLPATYNAPLFAVINDDGSVLRPFNLATNLPSTNQRECHYENNMVSFSIQNQTPLLDLGPDISLCKNSVIELSANPDFQRYRWQDGSAPDFTAYSAGKYWVDAFDACGFRQTDTMSIVLNTTKTIDLPEIRTVCAGDMISLDAPGFSTYSWSPVDSVSCADCAMTYILVKNSITIYLTAADGDCFVSDSVQVKIDHGPSIQLLAQGGACDIPASIIANVMGEAPFEFLWSDLSTGAVIYPSQSGTYTVEVTDKYGCTATNSSTISSAGMTPNLYLTNDTLTCRETSGSISVMSNLPNTTFLWSGADGFSSLSATPVISQGGTYTVVATDPSGGCTSAGVVYVPIDTTPPTVVIAADFVEIPCGQSSISISAAGSSNGTDFSIEWSATAGGSILSGQNSLLPNIGNTGLYKILITSISNGCTATDTVKVDQSVMPTAVATADSVRCFGEANGAIQVISTSNAVTPLLYSIDNQHYTPDPVFENLAAGVYQIFIRDANDCNFQTEIELAQPAPFAVDLTGDTLALPGSTANLQAIISPPDFVPLQIDWTAAGVEFAENQLEQSVQLLQHTLVQISIADEHGCSATDTWLVRVSDAHKIFAPNIIMPGNSGGVNHTFLIYTGPDVLKIESCSIFDRWGNQVFSNQNFPPNDESQGWNGTYRGKPVPLGVYVWLVKVVFNDGTEEVFRGDLTVVR